MYFLLLIFIIISCSSNSDESKGNEKISNKIGTSQDISILKGKALFNKNCLVCHNLTIDDKEKKIGPNLFGVTKRHPNEYLQKWIKSPEKLISSGDKYAIQLYKKYGQYMPSFESLKQEEIDNIILYLDSQ